MQDRLLLVDDDASLLKLLAIRLEAEGFEVQTAASAEEALQTLRNHPVELVLTDLRMEAPVAWTCLSRYGISTPACR